MSNPAEKPEVVQLPAETPAAAPVNNRRVAAQRVREARDRLTSTSGTRPAFDTRIAPAICPDPDIGLLCRHAAGGRDRPAVRLLDAADLGRGLDRRHALHPCRHHPQLPPIPRRAALARRDAQVADPVRAARPALRPVLDRDPDPSGRPRRGLEHADDVPDAAGDRGVEHAGGEPADRGAGGDRAGDGGDRAQFRARRHLRQLRAGAAGARRRRLFRAARPPPAFDDAGDAGSARRKGRADRRARTGQGDLRRGAASRRIRQRRQVALPGADEPRAANAAERDPRLFRGDEERNFRRRMRCRSTRNIPPTSTIPACTCSTSSTRFSTCRGSRPAATSSTRKRCRWCTSSPTAITC